MITHFAKVAYDAYCEARNWKSVKGEPLPQFEQQSKELQDAWQKSADAVSQEMAKEYPEKVDAVQAALDSFIAPRKPLHSIHGQTVGSESYRLDFTGNNLGVIQDAILALRNL